MADYASYARPKMVSHTVNSGEAGSGVAGITFVSKTNTDDLAFTTRIRTSANVCKSDFISYYEKISGVVYVKNSTDTLVTGDIIEVFGMFYV